MKYGKLNLGQIEAIVNKLGGMKGVRSFLSGETVNEEAERRTLFVTVDYDQTLAQMVEAGNYRWANNDITSSHFWLDGSGQKRVEIMLFRFNRNIFSNEAIAEMRKEDYRPATIEELLAIGAAHPELPGRFTIAALGSVLHCSDDGSVVPALGQGGTKRFLDLYWFKNEWDKTSCFAAVHK